MNNTTRFNLFNNSRFYILSLAVLMSVSTAALVRLQIPSDQLYSIRLQQLYGLFSIGCLYLAMIISPLGYVLGKQRVARLTYARRGIGVSAAYFALLHSAVALWGQLGGIADIHLLPALFQWSIAGGLVALIVLLAMAATSLDRVIEFMTFRKWKWLHRLVYIAGLLALLHIWTIGTHLAYSNVQWLAFFALAILIGLESYRLITLLAKNHAALSNKDYFLVAFMTLWIVWLGLIASIPAIVQNYHSQHANQLLDTPDAKGHHE
ncbi:MAG: ferric reductase-like transmembrane domain-containing protein [Candidatus Saccharimonadales bacterium]